ncbi:MAG TPA: hypothetical protein DCG19_14625 [Cryomorphaceae bacterium]|nr:hypothetical protein [Owenweeksia sp.]MBF99057.1 hypothetical protein [Owenweeksia sp.]HAD98643.1 hypothetical protein [Cryomorphaceae bacterium]HBF21419.1 hypothetical protein [Cryomorphaceae bacterium]HCQ16639.1 hypothetical protein [Cryomorphaceae bacterium]|tara:strand:+ start:1819 stop:2661 length:843 start_codon:yes stop_codon:yes gene_type:complete
MRSLYSLLLVLIILFSLGACQPNGSAGIADDGAVTDSLTYRLDTLRREMDCMSNRIESPCLQIEIVTVTVTANAADHVLKEINDNLNKAIAQSDNSEQKAGDAEDVADNLEKEYKRILSEITDYELPWELDQNMSVHLNQDGLFGTTLESYSFTGGAHGNNFLFHHLYSTETGARLSIKDLVKEEALAELNRRAELQFRESRDIPTGMNYNDAGYWFEDNAFVLPENFKYDPFGLEFVYNTYEIAPYSEGMITIRFDMADIENLIRPEYRLISGKEAAGV